MAVIRRTPKRAQRPAAEIDLKSLAEAANDAARRESAQWFFFVSIMITIAALVGSTTHRVLFLEGNIRVPFLGVELPLLGFYVVVPAIFVVLHFYTLAQLRLMSRKLGAFVKELDRQVGADTASRDRALHYLDSFSVVQLLLSERYGTRLAQVRLMAWTTLVVAPVLLLLFVQIRFLPYQSEWITWWHRTLVLLDIGLVWWLWPSFVETGAQRFWYRLPLRWGTATIVMAFSVGVATVPGESTEIGEPFGYVRRVLFDGPVDSVSQRPTTLFSRRLILPDEDFVLETEAELAELVRTRVLRGRSFAGAVLDRADLRKTDLSGAFLYSASLRGARLEAATLDHAVIRSADLTDARMAGASMRMIDLSYSLLLRTQLQGVNLNGADLEGAVLDRARLIGARLAGASLLGANLVDADLRGSNFTYANLQGAGLRGTDMRMTTFADASFFLAFAGDEQDRVNIDGTVDFRGANFDGPLDLSRRPIDAGYLDRNRLIEDYGIRWRRSIPQTTWHRNRIRSLRENLVNRPDYWPDQARRSWPASVFMPGVDAPPVAEALANFACQVERSAYIVRSLAAQLQGSGRPPREEPDSGGGDGGGRGGSGIVGPMWEPPSYRERDLQREDRLRLVMLLSNPDLCPSAATVIHDVRAMLLRMIEDR